jgi:hypothetical protein
MDEQRSWQESIKAEGGQILDQVKRLIEEGNVRRIVIKQEGKTIVEFPLTVGVVGAVFAPMLAAVGAAAALLTDCTIEVERVDDPSSRRGSEGHPAPNEHEGDTPAA